MRSNYLNPINYDPICNLNGLNTSFYSKNFFCKRQSELFTMGKKTIQRDIFRYISISIHLFRQRWYLR
jgi:hypothetical protein